ncbi:MAG: tail fiber domain-containing protein [Planctomycetota bacterium]
MNARYLRYVLMAIALLPFSGAAHAADVGSAFTYQGFLEKPAGTPLTDACTFEFKLCDDAEAACAPGTISHHPGIAVTDGVFTVADVDFGAGAFTGEARWMEVSVQCTGDGGLVALSPRVELTPTPHAVYSSTAPWNGVADVPPGFADSVDNDTLGALSCLDGELAKWSETLQQWQCLPETDSDTLRDLACADGQVAKWNAIAGQWQCGADVDGAATLDESYNEGGPGAGRTITADSGSVNIAGPDGLTVNAKVGIGTTSPAEALDVNGASRTITLEITGGSPLQQPLVGWGWNDYGQITVPSGTFAAVAAGFYHGLAIRSDGTLAGWGRNDYGQSTVPAGTFTAVAAGQYHSLGIRSNGTLAGWGAGTTNTGVYPHYGQAMVPSGTFTAVAAGQYHSLGIRSDGTLAGWGCGGPYDYGQCNVPSGTFTAVAAGGAHSVGIRGNGTLVGWGSNSYLQTTVPSGTFTVVAAGSVHSLAIRSDGTLAGWGDNTYGQINVPAGTFTAVAAGDSHSLAIAGDPTPGNFGLLLATDSAVKPGSNTWTIYSDRRLKKNIEPLSGALERLLQLHGVTFQWLDPSSQGGITGTQMGLIADEVQRAFPQWVGRDPKGYQTLTVGGFEALTAEALRELRAEKNQELDRMRAEKDAQIAELREQMARLEAAINALTAPRAGGGQ